MLEGGGGIWQYINIISVKIILKGKVIIWANVNYNKEASRVLKMILRKVPFGDANNLINVGYMNDGLIDLTKYAE